MSKASFTEQDLSIFEVALRASNQGFVVWDSDKNLVAWSRKCPDFWYQPENILRQGMPMFELLLHIAKHGGLGSGDPEQLAENELSRVKSLGSDAVDEFEMLDGRTIRVQRNSMPDGGHASTYTDITAQKHHEKRLKAAVKIAENANKAKSEFLASMSHELRTPLNAILGFAELMKLDPKERLSAIQLGRVDNLLAGAKHLLELINDLLDLSKIEAGMMPVLIEDVVVNEVVRDCLNMTVPLLAGKEISVVDKVGLEKLFRVRADPVLIRQALLNYLSNAVKYNKQGGTITIDGKRMENGNFRISVADTGTGIGPTDQASLFKMFYRAQYDSTISASGTGLGLYVTKMLIHQMDGQVGFQSKKGIGSTFWLELPLAST
jgi:signal transduction histidine kinase